MLDPPPGPHPVEPRQGLHQSPLDCDVPTRLSADEFSAISGITDERYRVKELIRHPGIMPRIVVLDPAVTVHMPEWLWLSTGIRALGHCVEGSARARQTRMPMRRRCTGCRCWRAGCRGSRPTRAIS